MRRSVSSRRTRPSWTTSSGSSSASRAPCPARRFSCGCTARTPPRPAETSSACTATTSSATWRRASRTCGPASSPSVWPPRGATSPPTTPASSRWPGRRSNRRARRRSRRPQTSSPCSGPGPRRRCPWRTRPSSGSCRWSRWTRSCRSAPGSSRAPRRSCCARTCACLPPSSRPIPGARPPSVTWSLGPSFPSTCEIVPSRSSWPRDFRGL